MMVLAFGTGNGVSTTTIAVVLGVIVVCYLGALLGFVATASALPVASHQAAVIHKPSGTTVALSSVIVIPMVQRAELMDLRIVPVLFERTGDNSVRCRDCVRVDVEMIVTFRVNPTADDILKVAQSIGCVRAAQPEVVRELFNATVTEAIKASAAEVDSHRLFQGLESFMNQVMVNVGNELNGYVLDDLAIVLMAPTPTDAYDASNLLDAKGLDVLKQRAL